MRMAYILANLAVSRARLQHAISTAHACGDSQYCRDNRSNLDLIDSKINSLIKVLDLKVIEEAREITNAPI